MRLDGRIAIVTGGASGIGREVVSRLGGAGAAVLVADKNGAGAAKIAEDLQRAGGNARAIEIDVTKPEDADRMAAEAVRWFGAVDILVHSAGIGMEKSFLTTSVEDWKRLIEVDLTGTFLCCQAAAKEMVKKKHGRIITLASTAGVRGGTGRAAYGASKGGVIALTKVMAVELAPHGITANALAPGAIETELVARMHSAETRRVYRAAIPMDRYGTPGEVASAALFLASDEAAYITGQVFGIDGGFLAAGLIIK